MIRRRNADEVARARELLLRADRELRALDEPFERPHLRGRANPRRREDAAPHVLRALGTLAHNQRFTLTELQEYLWGVVSLSAVAAALRALVHRGLVAQVEKGPPARYYPTPAGWSAIEDAVALGEGVTRHNVRATAFAHSPEMGAEWAAKALSEDARLVAEVVGDAFSRGSFTLAEVQDEASHMYPYGVARGAAELVAKGVLDVDAHRRMYRLTPFGVDVLLAAWLV